MLKGGAIGPLELLRIVEPVLTKGACHYFVTGSVASMAYGEFRITRDVGVVIHLRYGDIALFVAAFVEPDWYLSREAVRSAMEDDGQFNAIIHVPSGMKIDFMCSHGGKFDESRFSRVRVVEIAPDVFVPFASPEDVILKKLVHYKEGGGDKHTRDIGAIMKVNVDVLEREYIEVWAKQLGVAELWEKCKERVGW